MYFVWLIVAFLTANKIDMDMFTQIVEKSCMLSHVASLFCFCCLMPAIFFCDVVASLPNRPMASWLFLAVLWFFCPIKQQLSSEF